LTALFAERVTELPARCRQALLLAALDGTGDLSAVEQGVGPVFMGDLGWAERARVVVVDLAANRLAFCHPLLASAVVETATASERRDAHLTLARVLDAYPERRAWHLAEATTAPDESVARQLEEAAQRIMARGDAAGAIAALSRAARLSPLPRDKSRRLAEAAYIGADSGGALGSASVFLDSAREADPALHQSVLAAAASAQLLINNDGNLETAHGLLAGAIEAHLASPEPNDHFALGEGLHSLFLLSWYGGRAELWERLIRAVDELGDDVCELLWLITRICGNPAHIGADALERLERAIQTADSETDPTRVIRLATASLFADRLEATREGCWRVVRQGRRGESPARRHITALAHLCSGNLVAGRWDEVDALAEEGLEICNEQGYRFFVWYFRYIQAFLAGLRGDTDANRLLSEQIKRWAEPRGAKGVALFAAHARALGALGSGDPEEAYVQSCLISPPGELAPFMPIAMWNALDLVEAAIRTGRIDEAREHARAVRESAMADVSPRMRVHALVIEALTDPDPGRGDKFFEAALSAPQAHRWPFDAARAELLYGEALRRARRIGEARTHLASALSGFQALGAALWADRAAAELRAAGQSPSRAVGADAGPLTPRELEIATLAASGLTNKQIGDRLFLSPRTIGFHLYQLYPKLGITSRAALRDALSAL
jgi:DNA-binding CsgD family transcriptional regulator